MNKYLSFICMLLFFLFISCSHDNNSTKHKTISNNQNKPKFKVVIEGKFKKNDIFQLFYAQDIKDNFTEEYHQNKMIIGSDELQKITFELSDSIKPQKIRIDLGSNEKQESIDLKNISIYYGKDSIIGDNGDYMNLFIFNSFIAFDKDNFNYKLKTIDAIYDPYILSNNDLNRRLIKLYPPEK